MGMAAPGYIDGSGSGSGSPSPPKITPYVFFTCLLAGSGGLMYGYDLVVAGGVSIMEDFLIKFYPSVYRKKQDVKQDNYCKYDNQVFQLYTSCLYMAALLATFLAGSITRKRGHRTTMLMAGILFSVGTILGVAAENLAMLILGRVLLGCGLGFANQAIPLYLSEIAPSNYRGGLNMLFSINIALGIFGGNLVNYLASHMHPWGWRFSLGMAGVPAITITLAGLILVDSPSFLIRKNKHEQAKRVLEKLRGHSNIIPEFEDLVKASELAEKLEAKKSYRNLFRRRNAPQVTMAFALPFFQQFSGNDAILFYGPFLFKAAGLGDSAALYSTVVTGSVAVVGTVVSVLIVDRAGRRTILLAASVIMFSCMVAIGIIFGVEIRGIVTKLTLVASGFELALVCLFVGVYKGSWGPFAWLIPSEIFPQDIRSAAQSVTVFTNMLFKFIIAQTFLSMLCAFKFGIFLFFAGWLFVMGTFTFFFLPETKGIPIDEMINVWRAHWFWRSFVDADIASKPASFEMKPSASPGTLHTAISIDKQ
ncbi:hypothetical protein L7F22_021902 [Adiantum nelumboides]|nr:hypothetical protein [Adiantum nelumboides]